MKKEMDKEREMCVERTRRIRQRIALKMPEK
jgi:hypothetical protein